MIRIYLDWNVFSNLKKIENNKFSQLNSLFEKNKERFLIQYTNAHIEDLKKSVKTGIVNSYLTDDINTLSKTTNNHYFYWNQKNEDIEPLLIDPNSFFEDLESLSNQNNFDMSNLFDNLIKSFDEIGFGSLGESFKNLIQSIPINNLTNIEQFNKAFNIDTEILNFWDYLNVIAKKLGELLTDKESFLQLRSNVQNNGFDITNKSNEWDEDAVFDNIDEVFKSLGINQTLLEMSDLVVEQTKKGKVTKYDRFTNLYMLLDLIGYKSDKLDKPSNTMLNITTDSMHSFYGAYCDYFITDDKYLLKKSKAIYSKLNISTQVLKPDEFINSFNKLVPERYKNINDFFNDFENLFSPQNFAKEIKYNDGNSSNLHKFPELVFDSFNYALSTYYSEHNITEIVFSRVFDNFSNFLCYVEIDSFIRYIFSLLEFEFNESTVLEIRNTITQEEKSLLIFSTDILKIGLKKDDYKFKLIISLEYKYINT